jgi:metal-dependent amidase/aminoacylase/carboxypeptidase family protein
MRRLWILAALAACSHPPPPSAPLAARGLDEPSLIALRREIHREPELAGHEEVTARRIVDALRGLGFEIRPHVGGHGIVAILRGGRPGPVIAYRADMDAVGDDEKADVPFRSTHPGAGHICGHDLHVAVAVGLAQIFAGERAEMPGTLELIFQPGEEELLGARAMIDAGALADPAPREIYAVHAASLPVGMISFAPGVGLPGLDQFDLRLPPGSSTDEVAERIRALSTVEVPHDAAGWQTLLGQLTTSPSPLDHFLWVRAFVHPKELRIHVAVRAAHDDAYDSARAQIVALAPPSTTVVHSEPPFPGMFNDAALSNAAVAPLASVIGAEHVMRATASLPFNGEDFALFLQRVPGAMFWLGVADPAHGINGQPHSPDFQADERAIAIGARAMAAVIRARMAAPSTQLRVGSSEVPTGGRR